MSLLVLTGAAVAMEIGLLVACLASGVSPAVTGLLLGAFHVGYLCADHVARWSPERIRVGSAVGALAVPVLLVTVGAPAACPAVLVVATGLQALRRQLKRASKPPVVWKNGVKFGAMVVAASAAWDVGFAAIGALVALSALLARGGSPAPSPPASSPSPLKVASQRVLRATELAHHAHYFIYCYTFWRLIDRVDAWAVAPLFTIGWLAYFVAEVVIGRQVRFSPTAMALGHSLCSVCLAGMLLSSNLAWLLGMWFLTGVGGGTAYMLGNGPQAPGRERAEDWGHVSGTLVGGVLAIWAVPLSIAVAASMALITALLSMSLRAFTPRQQEGQISAPH